MRVLFSGIPLGEVSTSMYAETAANRTATAANRRRRVLLVEDSARLAASIRDYLERQNYEVFIEGDGAAVAERFDRLKPDLVILDLMRARRS